MDLRKTFRKWNKKSWYYSHRKIIKLEQGDSNLVAVLYYNKEEKYTIMVYRYVNRQFWALRSISGIKRKTSATKNFKKIVDEF